MEIVVRDGDIEKAIRTFRNRWEKDGLRDQIKRHEFFLSPSERRRLKDRRNARRLRKKEAARGERAEKRS